MRHKSFIFFLLILLTGFSIKAQSRKIQFHSINSVGFVIGESGTDMMLQSVNGFAYKNFYSGIGFAKDDYNYNSYPLFFDQRIYFSEKNKAFAYGDLGYNFSGKNKPGKEVYYYTSYHFSGSVFTDFGIGYKMAFIKKSSLLLSIGYSYKELNDKIETIGPADGKNYSNYKYGNGRIVLKAGVGF
jgi:hypothetical protein